MNELSRLSKENAELRAASSVSEAEKRTEALETENRIVKLLNENKVHVSLGFVNPPGWTEVGFCPLSTILRKLAPFMRTEETFGNLMSLLAKMLRPSKLEKAQFRPDWPLPANSVKEWFAYFEALGLIKQSTKKRGAKDQSEYWRLSELGRAIYDRMLIETLERNAGDNSRAAAAK